MDTQILTLNGGPGDAEIITFAAHRITQGALVAFPTETVYGIACIVRPESLSRLDQVKSREKEKRYTLHIADKSTLPHYVPSISSRCRRLIERGWPGPITLIFSLTPDQIDHKRQELGEQTVGILYRNSSIGIRCPANPVSRTLLSQIPIPVVAPSANRSGQAPARNAGEVMDTLQGHIDILIDADKVESARPRYGKSSTIVRVTESDFEILREGVCTKNDIHDLSLFRVLFVCTGNTCRSPMGKVLCEQLISEYFHCKVDEIELFGYKVISAGVMAASDSPASPEAVQTAAQYGLDLTGHRSRPLDAALIGSADRIYAMSRGHLDRIVSLCPVVKERCRLLDDPDDIPDPIGAGVEAYRVAADRIKRALKNRMKEIVE